MSKNYLIKKENEGFFIKLKRFFKRIFFRKRSNCRKIEDIPNTNLDLNINSNNDLSNSNRIYQLQLAYETGEIKEENLSEEDKNELILLYKKQIESIEQEIAREKEIFQNYKLKILEEKNKLKKM